jgi:hypothetical protein
MNEEETVGQLTCEVVDFKVLKEDWSNYRLTDGTLLKARLVVTKVVRTDQHDPTTGEPVYAFSNATAMSTVCRKDAKGPPSRLPPSHEIQASNAEPVDFESADRGENWNVYTLSDGSELRVKLEITKISRSKFFDDTGDPVYLVVSENVVRVKSPPSLCSEPSRAEERAIPDIYR